VRSYRRRVLRGSHWLRGPKKFGRPLKPDAGNAAVGSKEFEISAMRFPRMAFLFPDPKKDESGKQAVTRPEKKTR
jgi:hypothetical protein